jgi:hypothetical protein
VTLNEYQACLAAVPHGKRLPTASKKYFDQPELQQCLEDALELRTRIQVNLRTRWVQVFDHRAEGQLLYFKERFVAPDHPRRTEMEKFSAKVRKVGLADQGGSRPTVTAFGDVLERHGLNARLHRKRIGSTR